MLEKYEIERKLVHFWQDLLFCSGNFQIPGKEFASPPSFNFIWFDLIFKHQGLSSLFFHYLSQLALPRSFNHSIWSNLIWLIYFQTPRNHFTFNFVWFNLIFKLQGASSLLFDHPSQLAQPGWGVAGTHESHHGSGDLSNKWVICTHLLSWWSLHDCH